MLPDQAVEKSPINGHHFQCAPLMRMKLTRTGVIQNGLEQRRRQQVYADQSTLHQHECHERSRTDSYSAALDVEYHLLVNFSLLHALVTLVSQHHFFIIAAACRP